MPQDKAAPLGMWSPCLYKQFDLKNVFYVVHEILFRAKTKVLASQENTWEKLRCVWLSGRSQFAKAMWCVIPTMWHSGKDKIVETGKKKSQWLPGAEGGEKNE